MSSSSSAASPAPLGGLTPAGRLLGPALDKIVKNATWRKHTALVSSCKSALDALSSLTPSDPTSSAVAATVGPLLLAISDPSSPKVTEPALHCVSILFSHRILSSPDPGIALSDSDVTSPASRILSAVLSLAGVASDDALELSILRVLICAVRCPTVFLRADAINKIMKCCYNVYLSSSSGANQLCAKLVLAQLLLVVFARAEADKMDVRVDIVSIADMMDVSDRSLNDSALVQTAQAFITEAMEAGDGDGVGEKPVMVGTEEGEGLSRIREDGLAVFKNLCKLSMKFPAQENQEDALLLRGKVLSLELLKLVVENAGPFWQLNERYLGAIKQFLCLSLLKNSAMSSMSIFQLLCSLFMGLLLRFRSGLKEELGMFFPMLVLRVLENVVQPSFLQKMTILNLIEKICQEPQIIVDIFVNYDCDVDAPNIFERIVNGLLKTALGVPSGSSTTLSLAQDQIFRIESVKCLASIMKSMGIWMDQQLKVGEFSPKRIEADNSVENQGNLNGEDSAVADYDLQSDSGFESSDASTLEQRRAYKIELQQGIALFNRKPSRGIDFLMHTKKVGSSPEEVASFLRNCAGLNPTVIGDYLGERDEFSLKVMHAYVDSMNFDGMDFGEAIRFFLRGFRLPGEAQKIDRIMEKFAERYWKCNPNSFASADTAYVLAYSVIMLNTDAHNTMVKVKMSKADFIRNNRGINDGKDLAEDYLGSIYDQIVKNEIKMSAESAIPQSKQPNSISKLLGLDNIFSFVNWKQSADRAVGASDYLIKHIQEQFKKKSSKSESIFYSISDTAILRFMIEVCWAPMMAAFSVTLDQSDDKAATSQSLLGFRHAVHVTAVMCMQTQRDAFVTSVAKFTNLHCAADMKQKNVDTVKAIMFIALEDGNYLQESWEHVLTCLSRFEHLHLLGEGTPTDGSFLSIPLAESEDKMHKLSSTPSSKKKGNVLQNPAVAAAVRGGSYDSTTSNYNATALISPEQISNFISNINLLEQIGLDELNHIFLHSQRLNSDAIVAFVQALCKVSIAELQSLSEPRIFCLTKIVEIAHYNMGRIRLVWSRIWKVLSDFFVSVGLAESLPVAIFVMDSLRQLSMKFLERQELANYNFQNEFLRPFVVVMQKSSSSEVKELIVRCISQMVLSRVTNIKSGWKSVFLVFRTAAAEDRKSIVLLAFETMEKIVRDYFPYITETETNAFTDCVKCLVTFTNSKFSSDASLNALAFLRFCAVKLAEEGYVCQDSDAEQQSPRSDHSDTHFKDDHCYFWGPLLEGLSKLTMDSRPSIRKGAVEVLFDILKDHGHLFSHSFWAKIFESVIYPIFSKDVISPNGDGSGNYTKDDSWNFETQTTAVRCLVDLFVESFDMVRLQLSRVVLIVTKLVRSPYQHAASTGISSLQLLTEGLGNKLSEDEWKEVLLRFKEAIVLTSFVYTRIARMMHDIEIPDRTETYSDAEQYSDHEFLHDEEDEANMETASYSIVRMKSHIALQLLAVQAVVKLYELHWRSFSADLITILLETLSSIASHSSEVSSERDLQLKFNKACTLLEISEPAFMHFENESYQSYLKVLQSLLYGNPSLAEELNIEIQIAGVCEKILRLYLRCAEQDPSDETTEGGQAVRVTLPLCSARKEELAARTSLVLLVMRLLGSFESDTFRRNLPSLFPLLVNLVRCEHSSGEVQRVLCDIFQGSIWTVVSA